MSLAGVEPVSLAEVGEVFVVSPDEGRLFRTRQGSVSIPEGQRPQPKTSLS